MTSADQDFGSHRRRGDGRRGPAHAKTSPRWPDGGTGPFAAQGAFEAAPPGWRRPAVRPPGPALARRRATRVPGLRAGRVPGRPLPGRVPGRTAVRARPSTRAGLSRPATRAEYAEIPGWTGQPAARVPRVVRTTRVPGRIPRLGRPAAGYQGEYSGWTSRPATRTSTPAGRSRPRPRASYPGQPGPYGQYALHPDHPSWPESRFAPWPGEGPVIDHRPSAVAIAPPLPTRCDRPSPLSPISRPARTSLRIPPPRAGTSRCTGTWISTRRRSCTDTITDVANWAQQDVAYAQPAREQIWDAGSSQLADWIIEDANEQAAEIFRRGPQPGVQLARGRAAGGDRARTADRRAGQADDRGGRTRRPPRSARR